MLKAKKTASVIGTWQNAGNRLKKATKWSTRHLSGEKNDKRYVKIFYCNIQNNLKTTHCSCLGATQKSLNMLGIPQDAPNDTQLIKRI